MANKALRNKKSTKKKTTASAKKTTSKKKTTAKSRNTKKTTVKKTATKATAKKSTTSSNKSKKTTTSKKGSTVKKKPVKKEETLEKVVVNTEVVPEVEKKTSATKTTKKTNIEKPKVSVEVKEDIELKSIEEVEELEKKVGSDTDNKESIAEKAKEVVSNKDSRYMMVFGIALIGIIVLLLTMKVSKNAHRENISFEKVNLTKYLDMCEKNKGELEFVYLSSDDCIGCESYEESLKRLEEEYKITIKELNVTNINSNDMNKIRESNLYLTDNVEVPVLLSIKDSNGISGIKEYNALKRFIEYSKNPAGESFTKISLSKYLNLLKSKDKVVIYIGESEDDTCEAFSKTLESVSIKNDIKVYYLNTNEIITEENWKKLNESDEIFSDIWFKPAIIIVKDGKIIDYRMENMSENNLVEFFAKNGL